jgi:hypothetical protein
VELRSESLPFSLRGKNDELIGPRRLHNEAVMGAVLGVELKKRLTLGALYQAQAEWLLYAPKSMFPYVQVCGLAWCVSYGLCTWSE